MTQPENNLQINSIALEGGRGTGKTTVGELVVSHLTNEGLILSVNRGEQDDLPEGAVRIHEGKSESVTHLEAIRIHEEWQASFRTEPELEPIDPELSHELSYRKFVLGIYELVNEMKNYRNARESSDIIFFDRDLDTVIAYGAAELILSHPELYPDKESREGLIRRLWGITASVVGEVERTPADLTIYFVTNQTEEALDRGHASKEATEQAYEIDQFQMETQLMIDELYEITLKEREEIFSDSLIQKINVNGKSPEELAKMVLISMRKAHGRMRYSASPLEIPEDLEPTTIEELIEILAEFSSGAAFPGYWEVEQYGASNCVYNNASLVLLANEMNLGDLRFVELSKSELYGASPVHWCAVEVSDDARTCRVIDVTPFGDPYIGEWVEFQSSGESLEIVDGRFGENDSLMLTLDDPETVYKYMELAYIIEMSNDRNIVAHIAESLLAEADNESKFVFASVRYARFLSSNNDDVRAADVMYQASERYSGNLIIARELSKMLIAEKLNIDQFGEESLTIEIIKDRLRAAWRVVERIGRNMDDPDSHLRYYSDIQEAMQ